MCVARGYHVYKDQWDPSLENEFRSKHERCSTKDKHAVAVVPLDSKTGEAVCHLPREIYTKTVLLVSVVVMTVR